MSGLSVAPILLDPEPQRRAVAGPHGLVRDDVGARVVGGDRQRDVLVERHHVDLDRGQVGAHLDRGRARVGPHRDHDRVRDRFRVVGQRQTHQLGRSQEALDVVPQPEQGRSPRRRMDAHVVEDQGAALEAMGQEMDGRPLPGDELPIDPDFAIDLRLRRPRRKLGRHGGGMYHVPAGWPLGKGRGQAARAGGQAGKGFGGTCRSVTPTGRWRLHPRYLEEP